MIIERETQNKLKAVIDFTYSTKEINHVILPMESLSATQAPQSILNLYRESLMPESIREVINCMVCILNTKYETADLEDIVNTHCQLSKSHQNALLVLLLKFQDLFVGLVT